MKNLILSIFIIGLLLPSSFQMQSLQSIQKNPTIRKLKGSTFGQEIYDMLMVEIQTSSETADPVAHVIQMLQKIKDNLNDIQTSNVNAMNDKQYSCGQEQTTYQAQIDNANQGIADQTSNIAGYESAIDGYNSDLSTSQTELDGKKQELEDSTNLRNDRFNVYTDTRASKIQSIADLTTGRTIIAQLYVTSPAGLLQIQQKQKSLRGQPEAFVQVQQALSGIIESKSKSFIRSTARMITNFLENSQDIQADQNKVQTILSLIDSLIDGLRQDVATLDQIESDQVSAFYDLSNGLSSDISNLENFIATTRMLEATASGNLLSAKQYLSDYETQLSSYQEFYDSSVADCKNYMANFDVSTNSFNDQIDIINQVIAIFENIQGSNENTDIQNLNIQECQDGEIWSDQDAMCVAASG